MTTKPKIQILFELNCGEQTCGDCQFKVIHRTGLIGETHPKCKIYAHNGNWGATDMKRSKLCLNAQKKAAKL